MTGKKVVTGRNVITGNHDVDFVGVAPFEGNDEKCIKFAETSISAPNILQHHF